MNKKSVFYMAVKKGNIDIIKLLLLNNNVNINTKDEIFEMI